MKVGVLTFHRCINYGSYWQARCLVEGLRAMGCDAELLDHDSKEARFAEWRCAFHPQLPVRTRRHDLPKYAAKSRKFLAAFDRLPQSERFSLDHPEGAGDYDLIVVGSDEVWNFSHPWYGYKPIFFGDGLRTKRLASYAASFGNHDARHGIESTWASKLGRFDAVSVRDENSRRIVRDGSGVEPALVLDPCLQFPPSAVPAVTVVQPEPPYVAVYGHSFPAWFCESIAGVARASGRRLISIGYRNDWADEQRIEAGPEEFSALIAGAAGVATNFFHGCIFALHHQRPFVCVPSPYRYNKVHDLMKLLAVRQRLIDETSTSEWIAHLLDEPLDPAIEDTILSMRAQSAAYLDDVLA